MICIVFSFTQKIHIVSNELQYYIYRILKFYFLNSELGTQLDSLIGWQLIRDKVLWRVISAEVSGEKYIDVGR